MLLSMEHERLVRMIKESISLMCKSSLTYNVELNVEGLLGITLDKKDVVLVNIRESFQTENATSSTKRGHESDDQPPDVKEERHELSRSSRKKRIRRRSQESPVRDRSNQDRHDISADFELPEFSNRLEESSQGQEENFTPRERGSQPVDISGGDSADLNFEEIVIKEEVGDDGSEKDTGDFSFTGESFASDQQLFAASTAGMYPVGDVSQVPYAGTSTSGESQTGQGSVAQTSSSFPSAGGTETLGWKYASAELVCLFCGKLFSRGWNLQRHITTKHQEKRKYSCEKCQKVFSSLKWLQRHQTCCLAGKMN